jgi:DNA-binding response OmpR family regulator
LNNEPSKVTDLSTLLSEASRSKWPMRKDRAQRPATYRIALGRETLELGVVEFHILLFLASRPYHAFTRRSIAAAVSSEECPMTEETVDQYVGTLLEQLGVFHDYVQAVPYIGYRFKA